MEFKDLVTLYFERSSAMQTFWSIYVTIALGLLAFIGSVKPSPERNLLAGILSFSFVAFAAVNLDALVDVTIARNVAKELISNFKPSATLTQEVIDKIMLTVRPPAVWTIIVFHVTADILVLAGVWILTLRKGKA